MAIIIVRTHIPTGTQDEFDILQNVEFNRRYSKMQMTNITFAIRRQLARWNNFMPDRWHYSVKGN